MMGDYEEFPVSFVTCTVQQIKGIKFLIGTMVKAV